MHEVMNLSVALAPSSDAGARAHLIRADRQEDICFALWVPSTGQARFTALVQDLILPRGSDRRVHGNASFSADYFMRAIDFATSKHMGLALMHSHLSPGWQDLSRDDYAAEAGHAGAVSAATGHPFLGMTLGTDGSWSARYWHRRAPREYVPNWCSSVRVAGQRLALTYHPSLSPPSEATPALTRTIGVWGQKGQGQLSRLHVGIVGLGSVASIVSESLARMGIERFTLIDYDILETINLDRTLGATRRDVGALKIDIAERTALASATASAIRILKFPASVVEDVGYRAALDCDVLFCCVDRPWPRRVLNHIAYAHLIPVIDGGILVRVRKDRLVGADWHVHAVGPARRCLECWKAFDPSLVGVERDGFLDDPSYLSQLDPSHILLRNENVFPFSTSVAAFEVLQLAALVVGPIHNLGDQNYHYTTGTLDITNDRGCDESCLYPTIVGTGDSHYTVTGIDHGAAKRRAQSTEAS